MLRYLETQNFSFEDFEATDINWVRSESILESLDENSREEFLTLDLKKLKMKIRDDPAANFLGLEKKCTEGKKVNLGVVK